MAVATGIACNASAPRNLPSIVDAALVYSSNQKGLSNTYMRSGNLAAGRIGFKGTETLDGATQTFFMLENGFEVDTGTLTRAGMAVAAIAVIALLAGLVGCQRH